MYILGAWYFHILQSFKLILGHFSFEFRDSLVWFPWHRCTFRGATVRLRVCRAGSHEFIFQRDATEKSECKTLISLDPDEGSLLSQHESLFGSPAQRYMSGDGGCVTATHVQVTCLLWCLQMQMKQKKYGCRAPSRLTPTHSAACTCSTIAYGSLVRGPGTLMRCPREILDRLPTFVLTYKENEYFLNVHSSYCIVEGGQQSRKGPIAIYLCRYLSKVSRGCLMSVCLYI